MPVPGEPFHVVTTSEVMAKLERIETAVTRVEHRLERREERLAVHSEKIRALEIKVYGLIAGLIAALGIILWGGLSV